MIRARDREDREALALTDKHTRNMLHFVVFFCGRYNTDWGEPPIHVSETCVIVRAEDYKAALQYEEAFTYFIAAMSRAVIGTGVLSAPQALAPPSTSSLVLRLSLQQEHHLDNTATDEITLDQLCECMDHMGAYARLEATKRRAAIVTDLRKLFHADKRRVTRDEFVRLCLHVMGETRRVVIKFMLSEVGGGMTHSENV